MGKVVPYIGTWIETNLTIDLKQLTYVVPYIGTWIETKRDKRDLISPFTSYLI